jgi:replicative DNA helicase
MKKGILLLSLLLLASISQAQLNITNFTMPYLYKGENYSKDVRVVNATLSSGNYSIVIINGTYAFLLNMSENISFVENQGQIATILTDYYTLSTYPTKAELDALNSSFQSFLSSRGGDELECRVITGLSNPDGTPHLTCTVENNCLSCRTVPVCKDYMDHTLQSPDPMSSPVAKSILAMSYDFDVLETNMSKFKENIANLSSGISSSLIAIKESLTAIKSAINDIGKPPISRIYEQYATTHSNDALDFCKDFYSRYNLTALNSALDKATTLSSRVPTQAITNDQIASIIDKTAERKLNRTIREQREAFDAKYADLLAKKSNLTDKANNLLSHIRDNETAKQLVALDQTLVKIRQLGDARNYSGADLLAQNFSQSANATDSYISGLLASYDALVTANSSASDALFEAWLYVEPEDFVTNSRLEDLNTQKISVEFTVYNDSPMTLSEINNLSDELTGIRLNANAIRDEEASASSQQVNNLLAIIAKPVVSFSFSIIDSFMPLSYADKEKNASLIIGALLLISDIALFLIVIGAFFYLVRSRRIELHRLAKILWAFIFVFFLLLLVLGSLAIYNIADMQSHPTSFGPFISEFKKSVKVGIVADLTDLNGTMRESITNCSAKIASKMESLQKSVMHYKYDGDSCIADNNTLSKSSCQNALDANPVIILRSGAENKATFTVFYTKKALFEGDEKFFRECTISRVLG